VEYTADELIIRKPSDRGFQKRFKSLNRVKYELAISGDDTTLTFGVPYLGEKHS